VVVKAKVKAENAIEVMVEVMVEDVAEVVVEVLEVGAVDWRYILKWNLTVEVDVKFYGEN
jgi:hypothetical protein